MPCAKLIPNSAGQLLTPSAVSLDDKGVVLVGDAAAQRKLRYPERTATEFKRDMGSTRIYRLADKRFTPEQLSSLILRSLKKDAEAALGEPVTQAVISVPAYFNDTQRNATLAAAHLAEMHVTRLVNEPTAAAIAFGLANQDDDDAPNATLVFDLGGGTFDISVVEQFDGVIEIKASTGDNYLGGEDFTQAIANLLYKKIGLTDEKIATLKGVELEHFIQAAERIKRGLTSSNSVKTTVQVDGKANDLSVKESEFEQAAAELFERIRLPIKQALRDARINTDALDNIVLVGGSTRMPLVRKLVAKLFGHFPQSHINPDEAVALGAATQAALLARDVTLEEVLLTDVSPFTLGVATSSKHRTGHTVQGVLSPIIERNTIIPVSREENYTTMEDGQEEIELQVYQGEHRFVKDNIKLGELNVPIPARPAGDVPITVRFTYDSSGMLEVDVTVGFEEDGVDNENVSDDVNNHLNNKGGSSNQTKKSYNLTLLGNAARLDEKDIAARKAELAKLKIHPRDDLPNRALMERADRLYSTLIGLARDRLGEAINDFAAAIESQDTNTILDARQEFSQQLDALEAML